MPKPLQKPITTARYCVVTPYRQKPAAVTISPGHGIKLDLPNYAPGLAVMHIENLEAARQYAKQEKSKPYRIALAIGLCMLLAACSGPSGGDQLAIAEPVAPVVKQSELQVEKPAAPLVVRSNLAGTSKQLAHFYTALSDLEAGKRQRPVTVLHLGDSHIAADRFSGDMRKSLQRRFGNAGRGLVQPGEAFKYFHARGIKTEQSKAWKSAQSHRGAKGLYTLTGVRLDVAKADETLNLVAKQRGKNAVIEVEFLTGPKAGSVEITAGGKLRMLNLRATTRKIRRFKTAAGIRNVAIKTLDDNPVSVLGWSALIEKPGLRYVSLGLPGATALVMARWNTKLVSAEIKHLRPDLIVLGYGTNEGFKDNLNITSYQRQYEASAKNLAALSGGASLLFLGAPDSTRLPKYARDMEKKPACKVLSSSENSQYSALLAQKSERLAHWHAPANLARVRQAQKRLAKKLNAGFWDWSQVMGGACGTYRWANASPALAYGDKVHFTDLGGKRSATALYNYVMKGYKNFRRQTNQRLRA